LASFGRDFHNAFDHLDPEFGSRFYEVLDDLRTNCPVAHEARQGWWFVSRYEDVRRVLLDWETFSSAGPLGAAGRSVGPRHIPLALDPPEQRRWRQLLNPYFSPQLMAQLTTAVRGIADDLVDGFIESGTCDFVGDFTLQFPGSVFFTLILGLPPEDVARCQHWIEQGVKGHQDVEAAAAAFAALGGYVSDLVTARRESADQRPDVIGAVVSAEIDGRPASHEEQVSAVTMLILGGLETTSNLLGSTVHFLATHPAVRARLAADPGLRTTAVEEFLRYFAPTVWLGRTATSDTVIADQQIRKNDYVLVSYASANRDEAQFERACDFVPDREPNRHIAFGLGPHRCIGSHLARLMFSVALDCVLDRLGDLQLQEGAQAAFHTSHIRGTERLPLSFTPGPRAALDPAAHVASADPVQRA
jgi:cytochrome P450